jgi:ankyrin repeat protein
VNDSVGDASILVIAASKGNLPLLQSFISAGAEDVNIQNRSGCTALMLAAFNGHLSCVEYLVSHGADVNIQGRYGGLALMEASYFGKLSYVGCFQWLSILYGVSCIAWSRCEHPE